LKHLAEPVGSRHRLAYLGGAVALIALSFLLIAGRAHADQVYWANANSIGWSRLDHSEGGEVPGSTGIVEDPEGMAIDTTNGRIYVVEEEQNRIVWVALDGSGHGVLNVGNAPIDHPTGISIDPESQVIYWTNDVDPGGSIGWARLDETGGGTVGTGGATVSSPFLTALDTSDQRLYWWNEDAEVFSWTSLVGTGSGTLAVTGTESPEDVQGVSIDPFEGRLYWIQGGSEGLYGTGLNGGEAQKQTGAFTGTNHSEPYGLAYDLYAGTFYWGNYGVGTDRTNAIGKAPLDGTGSALALASGAPVMNATYPVVLAKPESTGEPQISASGLSLSCTQGLWQEDFPGSFSYSAPTTYSYQWRKGDLPIAGANGSSFTATESGAYSCKVTAANAAGSEGETSHSITLTVTPAKKTTTPPPPAPPAPKPAAVSAQLASTKPVKVKAGGTAVVKVDLKNTGGTTSGSTKVCGTLNKQAKKGLKTPACVKVSSVAAGKTVVAKLKVKTLGSAMGTYKFTVAVTGAVKKNLNAKVQVTVAKKK
jgi:hypothetical protein